MFRRKFIKEKSGTNFRQFFFKKVCNKIVKEKSGTNIGHNVFSKSLETKRFMKRKIAEQKLGQKHFENMENLSKHL
jgi:hypothetical protein